MNDRLELAARFLIAGLRTSTETALTLADRLIQNERDTAPTATAPNNFGEYRTAACHIRKGDKVMVNNRWREVVHIDKKDMNYCLYFDDNTHEPFAHNYEITVKQPEPTLNQHN